MLSFQRSAIARPPASLLSNSSLASVAFANCPDAPAAPFACSLSLHISLDSFSCPLLRRPASARPSGPLSFNSSFAPVAFRSFFPHPVGPLCLIALVRNLPRRVHPACPCASPFRISPPRYSFIHPSTPSVASFCVTLPSFHAVSTAPCVLALALRSGGWLLTLSTFDSRHFPLRLSFHSAMARPLLTPHFRAHPFPAILMLPDSLSSSLASPRAHPRAHDHNARSPFRRRLGLPRRQGGRFLLPARRSLRRSSGLGPYCSQATAGGRISMALSDLRAVLGARASFMATSPNCSTWTPSGNLGATLVY